MTITTANKIPTTSTTNSAVDSGSARSSFSESNEWIDQENKTDMHIVSIAIFLVCLLTSFFLEKKIL